ncbi:MAG: TIGR03936 family radical SAM-associated protein [Spirochaetaceae bacterium]|jgi:radical SAM superfamily enzyme YgiQ (UPF0313 family)|nr:TIGR03936 family radical SAM-associated protein [Spirochaetaceae bacterium]
MDKKNKAAFLQKEYIDPVRDLGAALLHVDKPGRYAGGEYGRRAERGAALQAVMAFPDLYEIGAANQAVRVLYNGLNRLEDVSCDRVFAPAPDFEAILKARRLPLYGLDTGIPLHAADLLLITMGYELGITSALAILEAGGIPILAKDRGASDPLVIMGGPCLSNPLPYTRFIDAAWIGEAEAGFFNLAAGLAALKKRGADRAALGETLRAHPAVYCAGKTGVTRAVDDLFAARPPDAAVFPVPTMKPVQHHGSVEIMRGCPNGCRFCHAGYWYRPMRQKSPRTAALEAAAFIREGGYQKISLSSLSTGDYQGIDALVTSLTNAYAPERVSFQLPSLKISSFSLPILADVAEVRKSGLTFAVETPETDWQAGINKAVPREAAREILLAAKKHGWRGAKLYFMLGLPPALSQGRDEAARIIEFVRDLGRETAFRFHINVGTFVPKPHTPFQRAPQLDEETALKKLTAIRAGLKPLGHKVSIQDPFMSTLEGIISRGDERIGGLIARAFRKGCRLDPWDDRIRKDIWREILEDAPFAATVLAGRDLKEPLCWDVIEPGPSPRYIREEAEKSRRPETTAPCAAPCPNPCGVCGGSRSVALCDPAEASSLPPPPPPVPPPPAPGETGACRVLFSFAKTGSALFHSHLTALEVFAMAFRRAGIPAAYSQGFNPLPRLEIPAPLGVGVAGECEIACIDTACFVDAEDFVRRLNPMLPEGFRVTQAMNLFIPAGKKKHSLSSLLWGSLYEEPVPAFKEKAYRLSRSSYSFLTRRAVLARSLEDPDTPDSYFNVVRGLYPLLDSPAPR